MIRLTYGKIYKIFFGFFTVYSHRLKKYEISFKKLLHITLRKRMQDETSKTKVELYVYTLMQIHFDYDSEIFSLDSLPPMIDKLLPVLL